MKQPMAAINMWALVSELGFMIALPLVILVIAGVKADAYFHTTPLFIIVAIIVSPVLSGIAVWRKVKSLDTSST